MWIKRSGRSRGYLLCMNRRHRTLARVRRRANGLPRSLKQAEAALCLLGDLNRWGWRSSLGGSPTIAGEMVPWITYPAIVFIWNLLSGDERVLELGAGSSTMWFAERVHSVLSLETSASWFQKLQAIKPPNVELVLVEEESRDSYLACLREILGESSFFDVVLVDGGPDRVASATDCATHVKDDGLLILDNSDVSAYQSVVSYLAGNGFDRLDFFGPAPGSRYLSCTSMFSKDFGSWLARQPATVLPVPFFESFRSPFREVRGGAVI